MARCKTLDYHYYGKPNVNIVSIQILRPRQIGWGIFTLAHAFVRGKRSLIAVRLMIGAFEAGFYPTAVAYLSTFYGRYDMAVRIGIFYGQYAIAGAFSGSIGMPYTIFYLPALL